MIFFLIALPSLLVVLVMKFMYQHSITTKEFFLHIGVSITGVLVCMALSYGAAYVGMGDSEIINGKVTGKEIHKEYCTSGSSCTEYYWKERCTYSTDSKGKRTKSCYSYKVFYFPYELFYNVSTTVGDYTIDREDRQGLRIPERFTRIVMGEIASTTHYYTNYLLANKDSIFYKFSEDPVLNTPADMKKIPDYPEIVDYYNVKRIINASSTYLDIRPSQKFLDETLSTLGKQKQVNIVAVLYDAADTKFVKRTLIKWTGGKKNDVLMFYGIDKDGVVQYFTSTSYAEGMNNTELHSTMRMNTVSKKFNVTLLQSNVQEISSKFNRLPAKEFEYLALNISPSQGAIWIAVLLSFVCSLIFGIYLHKEEVI